MPGRNIALCDALDLQPFNSTRDRAPPQELEGQWAGAARL